MKPDSQWIALLNYNGQSWTETIHQIQADAIRWAANLSGDLHRKSALDRADELDPPAEKNPL